MKFGQTLQARRKELGLSQEQLALELNVSRQAVSKWESGQGYPEVEKLCLLSEILQLSLDELMKGPQTADRPQPMEDLPAENGEDSLIQRFVLQPCRQEVEQRLHQSDDFARGLSAGIALLIVSVLFPLLWGDDLGAALMIIPVGVGVLIVVHASLRYSQSTKKEHRQLHLDGEVLCDLQDEYQRFAQRDFPLMIAGGVFLILIGLACLLLLEALFSPHDAHAAPLFLFTAPAVALFVNAGIRQSTYHQLLNPHTDA